MVVEGHAVTSGATVGKGGSFDYSDKLRWWWLKAQKELGHDGDCNNASTCMKVCEGLLEKREPGSGIYTESRGELCISLPHLSAPSSLPRDLASGTEPNATTPSVCEGGGDDIDGYSAECVTLTLSRIRRERKD